MLEYFKIITIYRVPNNDSPPLPRKNYACQKKMKTSTGSPFNSTSLLESPVFMVSTNRANINIKKNVERKKKTQRLPNICKFGV